MGGRPGRKASATQPTFTELTGSEALDQPLQDMISYIIRLVKVMMLMMMMVVLIMKTNMWMGMMMVTSG